MDTGAKRAEVKDVLTKNCEWPNMAEFLYDTSVYVPYFVPMQEDGGMAWSLLPANGGPASTDIFDRVSETFLQDLKCNICIVNWRYRDVQY